MPKPYAEPGAQMAPDAIDQAIGTARAALADMPEDSPLGARRAYEAFMAIYAPGIPACWDGLPARIQRAWSIVVETVREGDD